MNRVGLFIPCYVDQLFPHVGVATVELLERFDMVVELPDGPTCCGQPMANTGCTQDAAPLAEQFLQVYQDYAYVVCPSCCFGRNLPPIANHWRQSNGIILLVRADKSWLGQHRPQLGCQSGVGKEVSSNMMIVFDHLCAIRFILQHSAHVSSPVRTQDTDQHESSPPGARYQYTTQS